MKLVPILVAGVLVQFCGIALWAAESATPSRPNIVFILCDDLGYGDVSCLNPKGKIATPRFDKLASEGLVFTDAHSGSAVCSPTRYGVLTGRYSWRSKLQSGVLGGLSPRLIEPGRLTVAQMLKDAGYHTVCIGKWHLGMDWAKLPGKSVTELGVEPFEQTRNVDYSQPIANGPNSVGFDEYFGISASLDMVPYTFIENDHVTAPPTEDRAFEMILGDATRPTRKGPAAPGFEPIDVLPRLTERAIATIDARASARKERGQPFFLYVPLASPHTPVIATPEWRGKSGLNPYADFVMQTDAAIGRIVDSIDRQGLAENTLIIVTSDNGCAPYAGIEELVQKGHHPSYHFRGAKADIYEGGHRIPFIARWKGVVSPGTKHDQTIFLGDLMATCAEIIGQPLPDTAGEDSFSFLSVLRGSADAPPRPAVVHHSARGIFAVRDGRWKLIFGPGSGGWSYPKPGEEPPDALPVQLYDLETDIGEQKNLANENPEVVTRLSLLLETFIADGRSTPGVAQPNAVPIEIWKSTRPAVKAK